VVCEARLHSHRRSNTYQGKNGKQYVAIVAATGGSRDTRRTESVVVFSLPGNEEARRNEFSVELPRYRACRDGMRRGAAADVARTYRRGGSIERIRSRKKSLEGNLEGDSPDRMSQSICAVNQSEEEPALPGAYLLHTDTAGLSRSGFHHRSAGRADRDIAAGTARE